MNNSDELNVDIDKLLERADALVNKDLLDRDPGADSDDDFLMNDVAGEENFLNENIPDEESFGENDLNMDDIPDMAMLESGNNSETSDPDLDEINNLLNNAGKIESVDDDMLALLESSGENSDMYDNPEEAFDIFEEELPEENRAVQENQEENQEEEEEKPKKKKKAKKKKKKKADKDAAEEKKDTKKKEKGAGFLAGIMAKLKQKKDGEADETDEDAETKKSGRDESTPDTAAEENIKILEQLNKEDKKSGKEKKQKNKKEKKKSEKSAKGSKPAKKKAAPKAKKKKEKAADAVPEKPGRPLGKASIAALIALCATLIAGIYIVGNFLPEFVDRQSVQSAFRDGDYATVYRLFYGKKLSESEDNIYNRSKLILRLEGKLKSYENNMTLGREPEAVNALIMGVACYQEMLPEAEAYGVQGEMNVFYQQICSILENNYGVSSERAAEISMYDEVEYTKALRAILSGTDLAPEEAEDAGGEGSGPAELQDVLQEEEDFISE